MTKKEEVVDESKKPEQCRGNTTKAYCEYICKKDDCEYYKQLVEDQQC